MVETAPIERFLGPIDSAAGAFGLLGLSPREVTVEEIDGALTRMIARVHSHRQGSSAEAGEVILALHVAAAQLRDPLVQRAMLAQLPMRLETDPAPPPPAPTPVAPPVRAPSPAPTARPAGPMPARPRTPAPEAFQDMAVAALAHAGGWNAESRRRIAGIAQSLGLSTGDLRAALAEVADRAHSVGQAAVVRPEEIPVFPPGEHAPGPPAPRWLIGATIATFVCAGVLLVVFAMVVISRLPSALPSAPSPSPAPAPGARTSASAPPARAPAPAAAPAPIVPMAPETPVEEVVVRRDLTGALATLRRASGLVGTNPQEAKRQAIDAITLCGVEWVGADPVVVESVVSEVSSFLTVASRSDTSVAVDVVDGVLKIASTDLAAKPRSLREAVFASGVAARLSRDALPSSAQSRIRSFLSSMSGDGTGATQTSFGGGAALALVRAMSGCEGCPDGARIAAEWVRVNRGLAGIDPERAETALLDALGSVLAQPLTESTSASIKALVPEIVFGEQGSRPSVRVIGWFEDRTIPMATIAVFAAELISSGVLPGAPLDAVVSASGSEADRLRVRDVLAARLGVPLTAPNQRTAERLQTEARTILAQGVPTDPREALKLAARAAIVHQAAALKWVGRDADAEAVLASATAPGLDQRVAAAMQTLGPRMALSLLTRPAEGSDGQWALRYLQASHNEDERARVLAEIRSSTIVLGPADADVLAIAALGPNPPLLRKTAQRTLLMHATNPFVVAAVSEMIPEAVATDDVAQMLESLTGERLPDENAEHFRGEAARAVMALLLSMLGPSMDRDLAAVHEVFADAYAGVRSAGAPAELELSLSGRADGSGARTVDASADAIRSALRRDAQRYAEGRWTFVPLSELDRWYAARAMLPRTGLERFVVDQLALAEMLAYLVSAERPLVSARAEQLIGDMEREHLAAGHPFHQILAAERCIVSLWLERLGTGGPDPEGGAG